MSYQTPAKPAVLRKRVTRGLSTQHQAAVLAVNEIDGELWATNRYWVTRAARIAPLLAEYNLPADQPGLYAVDGKVSRTDNQVPELKATLMRVKEYDTPGTRVRIAGKDVYTTDSHGCLLDMYQLASGVHVGLLSEELAWLSQTDAPISDGCRYAWPVRLMFRMTEVGGGCNVSAAIIADVTRVITPHKYGTDPETRELTNIPEVTEPGEPILLAIVMATKYGES
jgi:hypothetical protein